MNKKTIISTASRLFAALTLLLFLSTASMEAQVTIGKLADPHTAAILDLSQVELQNLGLLLPHVKLTGLTPFQLLTSPSLQQEADATGMVVYNEAHVNDDVYPGIYVWDGEKWGRIDDGTMPPMLPLPIMKSGAACGNGILFSIPDDYSDWSSATKFVWTLTSPSSADGYTLDPVISGSKDSHFFVPYDGTERTYEVSVYAEGSKMRSVATIGLQSGRLNVSNFSIDGADCYDIKQTDYVYSEETIYETRYGVWEKRKQLQAEYNYSYSVIGTGGVPTYLWSVSDPDTILLNPPVNAISASIDIQFKSWILSDDWLINHPTNEYIVVLTCLVTDGSCTYVVSKEIKVGDRDCCTGLRDIEGIIYTAVRFGTAGCWMSENLAVTKNQKLGSNANLISTGSATTTYGPQYTWPKKDNTSFLSTSDAQNSNYFSSFGSDIGKPGLLYKWAAAVGAKTADEAQDITVYPAIVDKDGLRDISKTTSKDEDICPVGWYLPSDAEWYALENEIHKNHGKYSSVTGTGTGNLPIGYVTYGSHSQYMRTLNDVPHASAGSPAGASNPKESGFNALLVGYAYYSFWRNYGDNAQYWSSSSIGNTAYGRALLFNDAAVSRVGIAKIAMISVRCKKLD